MSLPERRFATGIPFLDRRLGGGIPVGRLVAYLSPPATQGELLVHQLLAERQSLYLTTTGQTEAELRQAVRAATDTDPDLTVRRDPPSELLTDPVRVLGDIPPESFVVVDASTRLEETDADSYLTFLNMLKERLRERDSVGVVHAADAAGEPSNRSLTTKRADHVWRLDQQVKSNEITSRLLVTKARGGRALTEPVPLRLTDRLHVDTSRRI